MFMQVNLQRGVEYLVSREQVPLALRGMGGKVRGVSDRWAYSGVV